MDEFVERLKDATDALEDAGVPIEADGASLALELVVAAHDQLRRLEDASWWAADGHTSVS